MAEVDTVQRLDAPAVLLVALDRKLEELCVATLLDSGLRILKSRHAVPACERMPVTMPKLIVASLSLPESEATPLVEQAIAVGARAIWVEPGIDPDALRQRLLGEVSSLVVGS